MSPKSLIVIGSGPGGYAAALEAGARGVSVTLVEAGVFGGTCVNRGCIPSKFFLSRAKHTNEPVTPILQMVQQKEALLNTLVQRMEQAVKSAAITRINGTARFTSPHDIEVQTEAGPRTIRGDAIILAAGSSPIFPSSFPKHSAVFTSDTIFAIDYLPAHLVVVGGGYIGAELACAFQALGSKVTLIEKEKILFATQPEFAAAAPVIQRAFEKRGMTVWTGTEVKSVATPDTRKLRVTCSNGETVDANALLLALGRKPNVDSLHLEKGGISVQGGRFQVNEFMQTCESHIYAVGDIASPVPLAHTATKEAEIAVKHLCGEKPGKLNYASIPKVVFTWPEAAYVGMTEAQAQTAGHKTRIDRYHFAASSKAMIDNETEGFWMILSDSESKQILGALIVGPQATELIHLVALAIRANMTTQDVADTVFAHPTLSEGFQEAMKRSSAAKRAEKPR